MTKKLKCGDDIGIVFGLEKHAKATLTRKRLTSMSGIKLNDDTNIRELDPREKYKHLGIHEGDAIQHAKRKEKIRNKCYRRVRAILHTELNAKNKLEETNTLELPVVTCSFSAFIGKLE